MQPVAILDFHTHAFPDTIAVHAMESLADSADMRPDHAGTLDGLLASMDRAGIARAVLCNIATRPEHFGNILRWSEKIRSERIIPLPSVHPDDPELETHLRMIAAAGFPGIKVHPYYQDFYLDDPDLLWRVAAETGMLVVSHTGFDAAFPDRKRRADPERILRVLDRHPELKLVTTHLGAWEDWDEVEAKLVGKPVYMEISYAFGRIPDARIRDIFNAHPAGYILFGTDSPWTSQQETLRSLTGLRLDPALERGILQENGERLLAACPGGKP